MRREKLSEVLGVRMSYREAERLSAFAKMRGQARTACARALIREGMRNFVSDCQEGGSQTEGLTGAVHTKGPDHSAVPVRKARGTIGRAALP